MGRAIEMEKDIDAMEIEGFERTWSKEKQEEVFLKCCRISEGSEEKLLENELPIERYLRRMFWRSTIPKYRRLEVIECLEGNGWAEYQMKWVKENLILKGEV